MRENNDHLHGQDLMGQQFQQFKVFWIVNANGWINICTDPIIKNNDHLCRSCKLNYSVVGSYLSFRFCQALCVDVAKLIVVALLLLVLVFVVLLFAGVALVSLASVKLVTMNSFDMLSQ